MTDQQKEELKKLGFTPDIEDPADDSVDWWTRSRAKHTFPCISVTDKSGQRAKPWVVLAHNGTGWQPDTYNYTWEEAKAAIIAAILTT